MGLLARIFGREERKKGPWDDYWYRPFSMPVASGSTVDESTALTYSPFWNAVLLISSTMGALPFNLYRKRADGGKDIAYGERLHELVHTAPNGEITAINGALLQLARAL